uniref:RNA exonuclease 1 homolog n=1 Tax=Ornithorhynchus anatinus TaxID=9258 RepID=A0A6I8P484_ORNAN
MLRSTGFFRAIDCPYSAGGACRRPYCHFRHRGSRGLGGGSSITEGATLNPVAGNLGYDPYNPELPKPSSRIENGSLGEIAKPSAGILELELVNKAIEVVRNEVEREQKKYEELLENTKEYNTSEASPSISKSPTGTAGPIIDSLAGSLEYNPGSYCLNNTDYHPTPLAAVNNSNKYTLDSSDKSKSKGSALEYVPKAVAQPRKYSQTVPNSKYVIDNSKPLTDLEYDPLSNYSARLLSKTNTKDRKGTKRRRGSSQDECDPLALKKHCDDLSGYETDAKFSDSEEEPSPVSQLKSRIGLESVTNDGLSTKGKHSKPEAANSCGKKEMAVQYDMEDLQRTCKNLGQDPPERTVKATKMPSRTNEKEGNGNKGNKMKIKKPDYSRTSSHKNRMNRKEKCKILEKDKASKEKTKTKHEKSTNKPKLNSEKSKNDNLNTEKRVISKKVSSLKAAGTKSRKSASSSKFVGDKGGKAPGYGRPEEGKANSLKESSRGKSSRKKWPLSHVDLFGDESGDEDERTSQSMPAVLANTRSDSGGDEGDWSSQSDEGIKHPKRSWPSASSSSSMTSDDIDYSILEKDLDYDSDPMEECLRIFNESTDVKTEDKGRLGKQPSREENNDEKTEDNLTTLFPGQKRRISHLSKQENADVPNKSVIRPYQPPTAQEICYRRTQLAQQQASEMLQAAQLASQKHSTKLSLPGEKKRIAHVPNALVVSAAQQVAKKTVSVCSIPRVNGSNTNHALKARTLAGMASKTTTTSISKRIAHLPTLQSASLKRPVIPTEFGAKVPTNIRQRYLNLFIDECLKFCSSSQEAFNKALSEEKVAYERSTSRNIYLNVAVNTLKKLRSLAPTSTSPMSRNSNRKVVSHEAVLGGKLAAKTSFTLNRSGSLRAEDLTGAALFRRLKEYLLTEEQLKENGYPLPHPEKPGRALLFTAEEKKVMDSSCRICCRCGTEYFVSATGNCIRSEECIYHWGRLRRQRVAGGWETQYSCCSGAVGSTGCQVAKQHVQDGRKENLGGFVKTFEKLPSTAGYPGIYALDCEMCYTKQGLELTRITVINSDLKVVYDTFVKPDNKVVDYNTRFSGVTEEDLRNTCITLRDVQAVLLNMFSADTILIGHSLESDLFALKLIHTTVVDTSVVFPHRLGFPYKRALRTLMADYLKRIIQDNVEGHDSSEDASACMELMIWKIKEDAKVKR